MTARRRGRPGHASGELTPDRILDAALGRIEVAGPDGLSMRSLAADLGVTPMALYSHFDGRGALIRAAADRAFQSIEIAADGSPEDTVTCLLLRYCDRILRHSGLARALIALGDPLPAPHGALTERLTTLIEEAGADVTWVSILIDHVHGFALSASWGSDGKAAALQHVYEGQLRLLLTHVFGRCGTPTN